MRLTPISFLLLSVGTAPPCVAQFRDGPPVITPAPSAVAPKQEDIAPIFRDAYRASGSPRIVLLWNRELSENSESTISDRQTTRESGSSSSNGLEKTTSGPTGSATLKDSGATFDRTKTVTSARGPEAEVARPNRLSARNGTMLQRIFVDEMNRGGVLFVDRAVVIRMTAAANHRGGGDPRLIEADALMSFADLLMEVLMVDDQDAPSGYGFDVRVKDLKRGTELASVYSRAVPRSSPMKAGGWVAGANDYVFKAPAPPPTPNAGQVGAALARDVMFTVGSALESANNAQPPRRNR
jgi:hypothetical protein